jgi:hypothetical protein
MVVQTSPLLIVAVALAVDVAAPMNVAALVNRNDIVNVNDAVGRSGVDEFREHRYDALEQADAAFVQLALEQLIELHDVEVRSTLHRRASGDRVVFRLIGPRCTSASPGRPGDCSPGLPQIRTCGLPASGSSGRRFARGYAAGDSGRWKWEALE